MRVTQFVIKVAERCNLACPYCYMYEHVDQSYRDRPRTMDADTFLATLRWIRSLLALNSENKASLILHGGEPLLLSQRLLGQYIALARSELDDRLRGVALQTNGTLVTREWSTFFRENRVRISVSLDGDPNTHDQNRPYPSGRGSYEAAIRGLQLLRDAGVLASVLCVVTPRSNGAGLYTHFRSLGLSEFDFLFPDCSHDTRSTLFPSLSPTPIADVLIPIFDAWLMEDNPHVNIRLFHSLIARILGGVSTTDAFGSEHGLTYMIIETDGSIHSNDSLKVCARGLSDSGLNVRTHSADDLPRAAEHFKQLYDSELALSTQCTTCVHRDTCDGGYIPHRYSSARHFDNPSVWCADIMKLSSHVKSAIATSRP